MLSITFVLTAGYLEHLLSNSALKIFLPIPQGQRRVPVFCFVLFCFFQLCSKRASLETPIFSSLEILIFTNSNFLKQNIIDRVIYGVSNQLKKTIVKRYHTNT